MNPELSSLARNGNFDLKASETTSDKTFTQISVHYKTSLTVETKLLSRTQTLGDIILERDEELEYDASPIRVAPKRPESHQTLNESEASSRLKSISEKDDS